MMGYAVEVLAGNEGLTWKTTESGFRSPKEALTWSRLNMNECAFRIVKVAWMGYLQNVGIGERELIEAGIKKETCWGEKR